jgi:hypothetical protein
MAVCSGQVQIRAEDRATLVKWTGFPPSAAECLMRRLLPRHDETVGVIDRLRVTRDRE